MARRVKRYAGHYQSQADKVVVGAVSPTAETTRMGMTMMEGRNT